MKILFAFLRLIRWPNLVFIALTQILFYYCILVPVFEQHDIIPLFTQKLLALLITASVLIAAAGYIINDYFDLYIDTINKPKKLVIDKVIKRRWAIVWHFLLSIAGIIISMYIGYQMRTFYAFVACSINVFSVGLLWLYSTTYKRKLLIGNILISLLTAWTIIVLYCINLKEFLPVSNHVPNTRHYIFATTKLFKLTMLYAGFAFIISLIREVVKDMEDMEGDAKYDCTTLPITWGVSATKVFVAIWIIILVILLLAIQIYSIQLGWIWSVIYTLLLIISPLIISLRKLQKAKLPADYHQISSLIKMVMLTGILSMIFFKFYA